MVPTDQGILGALEALLDSHSSPDISDLPPLHGGIVGYLGYDVIREVEHLPDAPPNDHGMPDADEHYRLACGVRPLAPTHLPHRVSCDSR